MRWTHWLSVFLICGWVAVCPIAWAIDSPSSELALSIAPASKGLIAISLKNTQKGRLYEILSSGDSDRATWNSEALVVAGLDSTTAVVDVQDRTNSLFFRAKLCQPTNEAVWITLQPDSTNLEASVNRVSNTYTPFYSTIVEIPGPVVSLNLGYNFGDDGTWDIYWPPQNVVALTGLTDCLTTLCASETPLASLDVHGLTGVQEIECFQCDSLTHVNVTNCPNLTRACFEGCNIEGALDFTGDTNLEDIRAALNQYTNVIFGGAGPKVWHLCVRNNPQLCQNLVLTNFYSLKEWLMWSCSQTGAVSRATLPSTNLTDVEIDDNYIESADFSGQVNLQTLLIADNILTNLVIDGCTNLTTLQAQGNDLSASAIDSILINLSQMNRINGQLDLSGNPNFPSAAGYAALDNLRTNLQWTVLIDTPPLQGHPQ